jgi:ParB/RepB/Spo0J family partition protein
MTIKETERFRKVRKDLIDIPNWLPRKLENDKEDTDAMEGLSENIKSTGLLNPITLREKKNGRFDLIAGSRRLKASTVDGDEVWARVENENIDEFDMRMKCASENVQRLDLPFLERDKFYYDMFELGNKKGKIKSVSHFARLLGISESTLGRYINAGRERCVKKNDIIITSSNTDALSFTRSLKSVPNVRNILLEMNIENVLVNERLPTITKQLGECVKSGITEKMTVQIIDMSKDTHKVGNNGDVKTITTNFDEDRFIDLSKTMIACKDDVRNYIIDKKISVEVGRRINDLPEDIRGFVANKGISVEDAEEISKIESKEGRIQLVKERLRIKEWDERAHNVFENKWDDTVSVRQQQEIDVITKGDTQLKTIFDIQHQRKLDLEADRAIFFDENARKRYLKIFDDLVVAARMAAPTKITKKEVKDDTTKIILKINRLSRLLLIDLGVLIPANKSDSDFIDVDSSTKEEFK